MDDFFEPIPADPMARLAQLDEDTREHVIGLALAIHDAPPHLDGLNRGEAKLVHIVRRAGGCLVTHECIAEAISGRVLDDPRRNVYVRLCHIRKKRPDLAEHIKPLPGVGLRWVA